MGEDCSCLGVGRRAVAMARFKAGWSSWLMPSFSATASYNGTRLHSTLGYRTLVEYETAIHQDQDHLAHVA